VYIRPCSGDCAWTSRKTAGRLIVQTAQLLTPRIKATLHALRITNKAMVLILAGAAALPDRGVQCFEGRRMRHSREEVRAGILHQSFDLAFRSLSPVGRASQHWFGLASSRPKRQSQPRNLVIRHSHGAGRPVTSGLRYRRFGATRARLVSEPQGSVQPQ
jgi:hypothetical protein